MRCTNCGVQNQSGFKFCANCGAKLPIQPADERRVVTILFANVAGLNELTARLDPEQVGGVMTGVFAGLADAVREFDGTIDKYIGEAIMVLFGAPLAHEDDPARALRCALLMQERLAQYNAAHAADLPAPLGLHVGINTGLVVAGQVGATNRSYSVLGDAVNLAARLEHLATVGQILVGEATWRLAAPLFEWAELGAVNLRGKREPVTVYQLLAARDVTNQVRGLGVRATLVGRDREVAQLRAALDRLQAGSGGLIAVLGEAGLGKSRLIEEAIPQAPALQATVGRCLSYGAHVDYRPWREAIAGLLKLADGEGEAGRQAFEQAMTGLGFADDDPARSAVGHILGLAADSSDPTTQVQAAAAGLTAICQATARSAPLVIVLEDLHWADRASLRLLQQLVPSLAGLPVLLVCVSRPQGEAIDLLRQLATEWDYGLLELQPLTGDDSSNLISGLLGGAQLPASLLTLVEGLAEGNPFYVEECVRTLIDRGALLATADGWQLQPEVRLEVPPTLQGIIGARIDGLPEAARHSLQVASVLGRRFRPAVLGQLDVRSAQISNLQLLTEREMLLPLGDEYFFRHSLTQEVAYGTLLLERRRLYHAAAADYYRKLPLSAPPRALADVGNLLTASYHYVAASDFATAYEVLDAPLTLPQPLPQGEGSQPGLYQRLYLWGEQATIVELLTPFTQPAAAAALTADATVRLISNLALAYNYLGEPARAFDYYRRALSMAADDPRQRSSIYNRIGVAYAMQGQLDVAVGYYRDAFTAAETAGDAVASGRALSNLGRSYLALGDLPSAREFSELALQQAAANNDRPTQEALHNNLGLISLALGEEAVALEHYRQALAIALALGHQRGQVAVLNDLGAAYLSLGDPRQATSYHHQALPVAVECDDREGRVSALIGLAEASTVLGDLTAARKYLAAAQAEEASPDPFEQGVLLTALGNSERAAGDPLAARESHGNALACFTQVGNRLRQARTLLELAADHRALGDPAAQHEAARRAAALARQLPAPRLLAQAEAVLAAEG